MSKIPFRNNTCCLPSSDGLTYLKVGPKSHVVGMMHLEKVFQQLYALGRQPSDVTDEELVSMTRKFNYISHKQAIEADYAVALRQGYTVFYDREEKQKNKVT